MANMTIMSVWRLLFGSVDVKPPASLSALGCFSLPGSCQDKRIRSYSDDLMNIDHPPSRQTSEAKGRPRLRSGSFLHPVIVAEDMSISQQSLEWRWWRNFRAFWQPWELLYYLESHLQFYSASFILKPQKQLSRFPILIEISPKNTPTATTWWVRHVNNSCNFDPRGRPGDKCRAQLAEPSKELFWSNSHLGDKCRE